MASGNPLPFLGWAITATDISSIVGRRRRTLSDPGPFVVSHGDSPEPRPVGPGVSHGDSPEPWTIGGVPVGPPGHC